MKNIDIGSPLQLLFPDYCVVCKNSKMMKDIPLCVECFSKLKFVSGFLCQKCGKPIDSKNEDLCEDCKNNDFYFDFVRSVYYYDDITSKLVKYFKYKNIKYIGDFISNSMYMKVLSEIKLQDVDFITYIPQSFFKKFNRYYNQSFLLAKNISELTGIPLISDLIGQYETFISQAKLPLFLRKKRKKMFYSLKKNFHCEKILLVDDVFTTGKTLSDASEVLKKDYSIKQVFAITFARS